MRRALSASMAVAAYAVLFAAIARSDPATDADEAVVMLPSADGHIGVWLVAGPLRGEPRALAPPSLDGPATTSGRRWRLVASTDSIDLTAQLGSSRRGGDRAALGTLVHAKRAVAIWVVAACDGLVAAFLGGRAIWTRKAPHRRGRGVDVVPVDLDRGRHSLVLWTEHPGDAWRCDVRVLDRRRLDPPADVDLILPGTTRPDAVRLARTLVTVSSSADPQPDGYHPSVRIDHPRGIPRGSDLPISVRGRVAGATVFDVAAGSLPRRSASAAYPYAIDLPPVEGETLGRDVQRLTLDVRIGDHSVARTLTLAATAPSVFARVEALEATLAERRFADRAAVTTTLAERVRRVREAATDDPAAVRAQLGELSSLVDRLAAGEDPLRDARGAVEVALLSELDGRPQAALLHAPAAWTPDAGERRFPLVVLLHGYRGTPRSVLRAFLDGASTASAVDGFVVAPSAHGDAFYRGPGERNVVDVLDWVLRTYPIDPNRVSITGPSMGGTGAAQIAFRYADRFSAASPLCGYHSYFVRRDTRGRRLRPWEEARMHHWSPSSWAENGRDLPLWVAHGTEDHPLENSRVLVDRYRTLGYSLRADWPETGHAVWKVVWNDRAAWPWLTRHRREPSPRQVTVKTDALRYGHRHWTRITRLIEPGRFGTLDARVETSTRIVVETDGVKAFVLEQPIPGAAVGTAIALEVDDTLLRFEPGQVLTAHRSDGRWRTGSGDRPPRFKRPHVEGPIRDVFLEPLTLVYGSLDPRTRRANREVARAMSLMRLTADVEYPMVRDVDLDDASIRDRSLLLVGTRDDHAVLRRLGARLPIAAGDDHVLVRDRRRSGSDVGAVFIHPNPLNPDRYVVVITAPEVRGIWRALSLPPLLPDFVVYDAGVAPAAAEQVLHRGTAIEAGFFNDDWTFPDASADPEWPAERADAG